MATSSRSSLELELLHTWRKSIDKLPVYKDLPRLAGRIEVEGKFSKPPNTFSPLKSPRIVESQTEITIREFLCEQARLMNQDPQTLEPYIHVLEKDWYFHVDESLALLSDEKWKKYEIPEKLVQLLRLEAEKVKLQRQQKQKLSSTLKLSQFRLSASFDSPLQVEQFPLQDKLEDVKEETEPTEKKEENTPKRLLREIKTVVLEIALRLENKDTFDLIKSEFDLLLQQEKYGDLELVLESLFQRAIGVDSKTTRVLKAIHQNIIFSGVFQLKSTVPMTTMTRDVRSREGWRINVLFNNNVVAVSHRRREQSLATAPADEQYWFEWELRMVFDKDMTDMESSLLRITDLGFDDNINPKKREEIKKALSGGNLIIS